MDDNNYWTKLSRERCYYIPRLLFLLITVHLGMSEVTVQKKLGETVTLSCHSNNSTAVTSEKIRWEHKGKNLLLDNVRIIKASLSEIEIKNLEYEDSGTYICYNESTQLAKTELHVIGKPVLTETFGPKTIMENSKLNLTCTAIGVPAATIQWEKNGLLLSEVADSVLFSVHIDAMVTRSIVEISAASYMHNGTYKCSASNKYGIVSHEAAVQVYVGAYLSKPPKLNHLVRKGTDLTLDCSAFGNPIPRVFWIKESANLSDTSHYKIEKVVNGFVIQNKLLIKEVGKNDAGNYTCLTVNSFSDVKRSTSQVKIQDVPTCCRIRFTKIASRSVNVSMGTLSDGNSEIIKYTIKMKQPSEMNSRNITVDGKSTSITIANLRPSTEYQISIEAANAIGSSNVSVSHVTTLSEDYVKCLVLFAKSIAQTGVELGWNRTCSGSLNATQHFIDVNISQKGVTLRTDSYQRSLWTSIISVAGLRPFNSYEIQVREIKDGVTRGWESQTLSVVTAEGVPSSPRNARITKVTTSSIMLSWDPPQELNGVIKEYEVTYEYKEKQSLAVGMNKKTINAMKYPERSITLEHLSENTLYNISIRERTNAEQWSAVLWTIAKTKKAAATYPVRNVSVTYINNSSVKFTWIGVPNNNNMPNLIGYNVLLINGNGNDVFNRTVSLNQSEMEITMLIPNQVYYYQLRTLTSNGDGSVVSGNFYTHNGVPTIPRMLKAESVDSRSIKLTWQAPKETNGIVMFSEVRWKMEKRLFVRPKRSLESTTEHSVKNPVPIRGNQIRQYLLKNLRPSRLYSIRVRESTLRGWGPFTDSIQAKTLEGESTPPGNLSVVAKTSSTITVEWKFPTEPNGKIVVFTVMCFQEGDILKDKKNITVIQQLSLYIATCENLQSNTESIIKVYPVSSVKGKPGILTAKTNARSDAFPWLPIIGGCAGLLLLIALIATITLLCRRRPKYEEVNETFDEVELNGIVKSRPIHISNLKQYVMHNHINSDHGFFTEYESIKPPTGNLTWEHSQQECNQHKNRYSNIVAYDHTRVILSPIDNQPGSTYINANYIDGYKHPRKFIATQGPLPETVHDFWRMIYEQNSHVIIMLTRIIECNRVKCEQYWPDHGSMQYGDIIVKLIDVTELSDYVVRTFNIKSTPDEESPYQEVKQYHYLGWPDHGVPEYPTSMVTFTKGVMDSVPAKPGPIVVHCSAGVGRTGTLIVIDAMLNQIRDESIVDVYWFVSSIRKQRNFMVQTEAQYVFIYDALLDAVICGITEVFAQDIAQKLHHLNQQCPDTSDTYLRQEFKRLEAGLGSQEKELFSVANLPENKEKNRFVNILPFNRNRVKLAYIYGMKGSDYINASYIDGYRQRHVYIATQAPLENTVGDFWRMIWEQNCHNIVMLTKLKEKGQDRCHQYWPSCGSETYGKFLVDDLGELENENENIRQQELNLTYTETGRSRRIKHYMFTGWPDYGSPSSGRQIIKLVAVIRDISKIKGNGPIVVHCSGGAGRTGTFIALCICTQKLREGGSVDVFQTVRQLRTQRIAMVQTIDQYYFCYQALKDYVDSSDVFYNHENNHESLA